MLMYMNLGNNERNKYKATEREEFDMIGRLVKKRQVWKET